MLKIHFCLGVLHQPSAFFADHKGASSARFAREKKATVLLDQERKKKAKEGGYRFYFAGFPGSIRYSFVFDEREIKTKWLTLY